ncbi:tyrosine-type recombinase/integrase [Sinorhizobium meliloti]|uniref:tyrosine-type recombinase/integrase n=1 Tax=Rhizobium meliloti TaxID=382 RepID=UPI000FDAD6F4|nr:site-specific integrase [Sinorhizobium meliloti]RVH53125.1 integrase [Sinorhizobium meliloti]
MGVRGKVEQLVDNVTPVSNITIQERRSAEGLDAHVPTILRDGVLYDPDLDRFFRDLPLNGVRSHHSLRAYGYDVLVWVRFLSEACGKTVWQADRHDVLAYHRVRRRAEAGQRISAASWNRAVACLDRLYRWGVNEGLIAEAPFAHRTVWRQGYAGRRAQIAARNDAYEPAARRADVSFVTLDDYRIFRGVGLRGFLPDGGMRPGARDRNGIRNALFSDLLVTTGLRLEEASFLFASDLAVTDQQAGRQVWLDLPDALTKGDRGRQTLLPARLLEQVRAYIAVERAHAVAKFQRRSGWLSMDRPIFVSRERTVSRLRSLDGGAMALDLLSPEERGRIIVCADDGTPREPAVLWLSEVGLPVQPNSWEVIFARASERCRSFGFDVNISPHQLRHTFAVHMLAMLIQHRLRDAALPAGPIEGYRQILGDPLQQVQRLLGHASLATTYVYLDHIATRADTVDAAVEELLALLPSETSL